MCEALDNHEGSVSIGGRLIITFCFADDNVGNAEEEEEAGILVDRLDTTTTRYHKVQNGDRSRQDKSDDKQPKWLPKRDQDKRSEARRSGELQVPWDNQPEVLPRIAQRTAAENHMDGQGHIACF